MWQINYFHFFLFTLLSHTNNYHFTLLQICQYDAVVRPLCVASYHQPLSNGSQSIKYYRRYIASNIHLHLISSVSIYFLSISYILRLLFYISNACTVHFAFFFWHVALNWVNCNHQNIHQRMRILKVSPSSRQLKVDFSREPNNSWGTNFCLLLQLLLFDFIWFIQFKHFPPFSTFIVIWLNLAYSLTSQYKFLPPTLIVKDLSQTSSIYLFIFCRVHSLDLVWNSVCVSNRVGSSRIVLCGAINVIQRIGYYYLRFVSYCVLI